MASVERKSINQVYVFSLDFHLLFMRERERKKESKSLVPKVREFITDGAELLPANESKNYKTAMGSFERKSIKKAHVFYLDFHLELIEIEREGESLTISGG